MLVATDKRRKTPVMLREEPSACRGKAHPVHCFSVDCNRRIGYPKEVGLRIAVDEINAFLLKHDMLIYLVIFDF